MSSIELMGKREEEIGKLISLLSEKSKSFTEPKMVVIGGYALRAFIPFSRYSRDCDFVMREGLLAIKEFIPNDVSIETFEIKENYGFMKWIKFFDVGRKKAKLGIDFMEKEVRGRENEVFTVDDKFLTESWKTTINIGNKKCEVFVPSYTDFFILKVVASRKSDIRDIASLVWKNGVPDIKSRLSVLNNPTIFTRNLREKIIPKIGDKTFVNSWRGAFITESFEEKDKEKVVEELKIASLAI